MVNITADIKTTRRAFLDPSRRTHVASNSSRSVLSERALLDETEGTIFIPLLSSRAQFAISS